MKTKMQFVALVACVMMILPSAAFATPSWSSQYAQAAMSRITCNTNLVTGFINDVMTNVPSATSLSQNLNTINSDTSTLQGYANNNDRASFLSFVKNTYKVDVKSAFVAIHDAIKASNVTKDVRSIIKSDYSSLKSTYKGCMYSAFEQLASAKTQALQLDIAKMQNRSNTLASKGIDTTALNQVISNADSQLASLQAAIGSANDSKSLKAALGSYCLYNGCKNGNNFHFAAKSAIAAQQAVLNLLQTNSNATQYSSQITQAQNDLNAAQSTLNTVGTGQYSGTQQSDVWNNIKAASSIIHQLWSELNHK